MTTLTFDDIRNRGLLIYEYIRGSHAYGLQKEDGTSDVDTAGVFIEPDEWLDGLGLDYQEQIADEKNDNVWYSLRKFVNLLVTANPNALEALFVPDRCVIYEHPIMTELKKHRDEFLTKKCFDSLCGYSTAQIKRARGLNKKINWQEVVRKDILDFCYTFKNQGSQPIKDFLKDNNLDQRYCGLVNIPNMKDVFGVYYDFAAYFKFEFVDKKAKNPFGEEYKLDDFKVWACDLAISHFLDDRTTDACQNRVLNREFFHYKGIVEPDQIDKSNEVRLCSIPKGEKPICFMTYNKDAYTKHCKDYKEWCEWVRMRNPERYKENKEKDFDRKNMAHSVRLLHMGIELAETGKFNVDRTNIDRDFIMNIRLGNATYDELINYLESRKEEMETAMANSTIPESIDVDKINDVVINIRKEFRKNKQQ